MCLCSDALFLCPVLLFSGLCFLLSSFLRFFHCQSSSYLSISMFSSTPLPLCLSLCYCACHRLSEDQRDSLMPLLLLGLTLFVFHIVLLRRLSDASSISLSLSLSSHLSISVIVSHLLCLSCFSFCLCTSQALEVQHESLTQQLAALKKVQNIRETEYEQQLDDLRQENAELQERMEQYRVSQRSLSFECHIVRWSANSAIRFWVWWHNRSLPLMIFLLLLSSLLCCHYVFTACMLFPLCSSHSWCRIMFYVLWLCVTPSSHSLCSLLLSVCLCLRLFLYSSFISFILCLF